MVFFGFYKQQLIFQGSLVDVLTPLYKKNLNQYPDQLHVLAAQDTNNNRDWHLAHRYFQVISIQWNKDINTNLKRHHHLHSIDNCNLVGRPKLGVVPKEITLLPQQWQWLNMQPGGASATLRRLINQQMQQMSQHEQLLIAQQQLDHCLQSIAGKNNDCKELSRALYQLNEADFNQHCQQWPKTTQIFAQTQFKLLKKKATSIDN